MSVNKKKPAINALLEIYKNSIEELKVCIKDINYTDLVKIVDKKTKNPSCVSIQSILTHIVYCGYSYPVYIKNHKYSGDNKPPAAVRRKSVKEYLADLDEMYKFNADTFKDISDSELLQYDPKKKIKVYWGELYDYEQIIEHAIIHIYRHKLQIENFRKITTNDR